jgi:hypothetical protein
MMTVQSSGDIEIFCHPAGATSRGSVPFFDKITVGDKLSLIFVPEGSSTPPYSLKIFSPSGATVLDKLVRDPPTGGPQSPPPLEFIVSARGVYRVEVRALKGTQRGEATIRVE